MFKNLKCSFKKILNITKLSGGVNLRDSVNMVEDNQLIDCKNVWFKDGCLKTRPRLVSNSRVEDLTEIAIQNGGYSLNLSHVEINRHVTTILNGQRYVLCVLWGTFKNVSSSALLVKLQFINCVDANDKVDVGSFLLSGDYSSVLTFMQGGDIYCFANGSDMGIVNFRQNLSGGFDAPQILTDSDIYTPTVYTDCKISGSLMALDESGDDVTFAKQEFSGVKQRGINLLSSYYKCVFSTVNKSLFTSAITKMPMEYILPIALDKSMAGKTVTAKITYPNGRVAEHSVTLLSNGQGYEEAPNPIDGLLMSAKGQKIFFETEWNDEYTVTKYLTAEDYIKDNMELTLPCADSETNKRRVVGMTRLACFGGDNLGLLGGSRTVLGGNTDQAEQALVVWNDPAQPLYFSDDNCVYVGNRQEPVTTFGNMGESLVIFKDSELFVAESSKTADFPIKRVHTYIGCDCPDTVELCRNRLVWTNSDGKVYTLVSKNQYDERAVFCISQMIDSRLGCEENLKNARSTDYNGHYILSIGNKMYVMDYNSYGYIRVSSQTKNEDANKNIPWYFWQLPIAVDGMFSTPQSLNFVVCKTGETATKTSVAVNWFCFDEKVNDDLINLPNFNGQWTLQTDCVAVQTEIKTKLFDFNLPANLKAVNRVTLSFVSNFDACVLVSFVSERQNVDDHALTVLSGSDIYSCSLFPRVNGSLRFGVNISSNSPLALNSLSLQYKILKLI